MERFRAVMQVLAAVEKEAVCRVVVLDDSKAARDFGFVNLWLGKDALELVQSPRNFEGDHWRGGLTVNYLSGLQRAFDAPQVDFAMVIDSDALPLRPFSDRVGKIFAENQRLGVLGSGVLSHPDGSPRGLCTWDKQLKKWRKLVRLRREPFPRIETALGGGNAHVRRVFLRAFPIGNEEVLYAQGGAFAVSRSFISAYTNAGYADTYSAWLHTDMPYDVAFGVINMALGLEAKDDNHDGGVFGVVYRGLPFEPDLLLSRNHAWVHSLKTENPEREREQRNYLVEKSGLDSAADSAA